ncbi:MAG: beta/gamma crystallin-related protein [Nostoc sp.]|uniref:beta/gamma crystallin-related protein n=1 Tax=Nostoc sp. TaxID=1180 RepID=UPI002FF71E12
MSKINNNGVDMNNNTLAQLNLSAVKELNDEVAASCSGGEGFLSGPGSDADVILYKDPDGQGQSLGVNAVTGDGVSNIGLLGGQDTTFNDQTSSIRVVRGTWSFFQDQGYGGDNTGLLAPGLYNLGHNNDAITSAFRNV